METGTTVVAPETEEAVVAIETIHQTARARALGARALAAAEITEDPKAKHERRSSRVSKLPPWQVRPKLSVRATSPVDGVVQKASVS